MSEDYTCPYCGEPWVQHEQLTHRPPRWMCADESRFVKTLAHENCDIRSGPDMIATDIETGGSMISKIRKRLTRDGDL